MTNQKLTEIRKKIDALDEQIQNLINLRAECALEVAKSKQHENRTPVYYRPEREMQILRKIIARNSGPLPKKDMADIFLYIMAKCRALQQPIRIAIGDQKNTLVHKAALKHFGKAIIAKHFATIKKVFNSVATQKANFGIVPIENSLQGVIKETLDALVEFPLQICGEIESAESTKIGNENLNNITRFFIIGTEPTLPSGSDKTSLFVSIANKPGSLAKIFQPFANHDINITFFESRPYRNKLWNYLFFIDIDGHQQNEIVQKALQDLAKQPLIFTILGSYPKAIYD